MHRLIYSSRCPHGTSRDELRDILDVSRHRNAEVGLTGELLYSGSAFLQVLEGEEAEIRAIFARIRRDPRHTEVRVLVDEPTAARSFGRWAMGFTHLDGGDADPAGATAAALVDGEVAEALLRQHAAADPTPR